MTAGVGETGDQFLLSFDHWRLILALAMSAGFGCVVANVPEKA